MTRENGKMEIDTEKRESFINQRICKVKGSKWGWFALLYEAKTNPSCQI